MSTSDVDVPVVSATQSLIDGELVDGAGPAADVIDEHSHELAALKSLDVGKPWPSAHDDEMPLTIDTYRFMAGAARKMTGVAAGEYVAGHTSMIRRDPVGPVAAIAPWNYPLMMAAWKLAAPLAAGCNVVLKPSELETRT